MASPRSGPLRAFRIADMRHPIFDGSGAMLYGARWNSPGRATLSLLDHIRVDYYGTPSPLNQVATLHVPEPNLITITPWDASQIGPIEKAIRVSDLGLNPANDGKMIRLPIPPLT